VESSTGRSVHTSRNQIGTRGELAAVDATGHDRRRPHEPVTEHRALHRGELRAPRGVGEDGRDESAAEVACQGGDEGAHQLAQVALERPGVGDRDIVGEVSGQGFDE
jgi:hypothetical protein